MIVFTQALNPLLMLLVPAVLALALWRRFSVPMSVWAAGAFTFVASQLVHLPLNMGVTHLFASGTLPMPSPAVTAWLVPIGLGLSAGVCEETSRYVVLRVIAKRARSWASGLMFGAGHGGIEAILLGLLTAFGFVNMLVLRSKDPASLGIPAEQLPMVREQVTAYWSMNPLLPLVGSLERVFAITCHLGMAQLVMQAVRRSWWWLLAAIAFHAALDAIAVVLAPRSVLAAEVVVALFAVGAAGILYAFREPA